MEPFGITFFIAIALCIWWGRDEKPSPESPETAYWRNRERVLAQTSEWRREQAREYMSKGFTADEAVKMAICEALGDLARPFDNPVPATVPEDWTHTPR